MTDNLDVIKQAFAEGKYRYTEHAVKRTTDRHISRSELEQSIASGEIIEEYPDDKYGPSYLIYGQTNDERHLHILVSAPPVKIITAYEPDEQEWEDYRKRKNNE